MAEANVSTTGSPEIEVLVSDNSKRRRIISHDEDARGKALCINLLCKSGVGLMVAPVFVQTFYNVPYSKGTLYRVCEECYSTVEKHCVKLRNKLVNDEPLIEVVRDSSVLNSVILDPSDETFVEKELPEEVTEMLGENFKEVFKDTLEKYHFDRHVRTAVDACHQKWDKVAAESKDLEETFDQLQKDLDEMRLQFYQPFKREITFLEPIDLSEGTHDAPLLGNFKVKQTPPTTPRPFANFIPPTCVIPSESDIIKVNEVRNDDRIRPAGQLVIPKLRIGTPVIACKASQIVARWERGKIFGIDNTTDEPTFRVRFNETMICKSLTKKFIAYAEPSPTAYYLAARVVAYYRSREGTRHNGHYVGVVGEPAKSTNNFRYLIFFDSGFAEYVEHNDVYPVTKLSPNIADDIDIHSRDFIANYIRFYPERPMVRLQTGQSVLVQVENRWSSAKVLEIDCSLVKIVHISKDIEWIYRGSTRLKPLYDQTHRRHQGVPQSILKQTNRPYVYWNREGGEPARMVAKKTTRPNVASPRPLPPRLQPSKIVEFKTAGTVRPVFFQNRVLGREYVPHSCGPACVSWTNYKDYGGRKMAPLTIPLQVGFERYIHKVKKKVMFVTYSGPCGRMIRNADEMSEYLKLTRCYMGMDLFTFEEEIRAAEEFSVPRGLCKYFTDDVSNGAENVEIQCINEITPAQPDPLIYSTVRMPLEGVNINTDPAFRVCCDCTDDCSDKEKCACWQLTLAAPQAVKNITRTYGYTHRRLENVATTGIYECYNECSCIKAICTNRVVQFPMTQKLQLFLTMNKGWGLRTLTDVPAGSLLAIYVGLLMNESRANEDGRKYGDEYFAEIDFIENAEQIKQDYESQAEYDDDDSDEEEKMESDHEFVPEVPVQGPSRAINTRSKKKKKEGNGEDRPRSNHNAVVVPDRRTSVRHLFGPNEDCYVMDAKKKGNIGRYLNHSCDPNTMVQNVFIDTHDPRFPWVAFFALKNLKAGTELTWDYGYPLSEDGQYRKYCYCGSTICRRYLM